ncbi:ABC transporter permease [Pseudoxanthomonas kaohsiungensis]|uniref:ABC transporter permease n=1 Tax=Pseudoxanthomonas kaohsiungensis TaxID=283923 RepID=UPI0035AF1474
MTINASMTAMSPTAMIRSALENRSLIYQLAKREVISRYRGSLMGLAWSFFNPLLMLAVYTFVFSVVFQARWSADAPPHTGEFAVILFVGVIVHGIFAECINRAPGLILGNASYVKRVVFPLETLPWVALLVALFHAAVSVLVLFLALLLVRGYIPLTTLYLPLVVLPLVLTTMGAAWLLAALGVFVRDIGQITGIFTTVLLFLSPVFYPVSALPENFQRWIYLNPLTFIIEQARNVLVWGLPPDLPGIFKYTLLSTLVAWLGFAFFQKTRRGFADVI